MSSLTTAASTLAMLALVLFSPAYASPPPS